LISHDQPTKQENIMIKSINARNVVLAFTFVGFAGIGVSSLAGQASAGMLEECHASSKTKVVACCKQHIERFGRPTWMSNGEDNNCRVSAVKCVSYKSEGFVAAAVTSRKPYCYFEAPSIIESGRPSGEGPKDRGGNGLD
jgi:hypothetical protein